MMTNPSLVEASVLPPLMSIHTAWQSPWLLAAVAEHGEAHYDEGAPIQDAHRLSAVGPHIIMALSDGVSTQPRAATGARLAIAAAERHLASTLGTGLPTPDMMRAALGAAHRAIADAAAAAGCATREFAATLAVAVLTGDHVAAAGIGDSSVLAYTESGPDRTRRLAPFLSSPQARGKGTYSISERGWETHVASRAEIYPHLKAVLLTSDGANNYFTFDTAAPGYNGFQSENLDGIDDVLSTYGIRRFALYWVGYLMGEPANDLDDRTILLAYRPAQAPNLRVA
jgi:Protein phosphatase 2C